jgi:DNA-binding XRE family transcriptional regulator
MPDAVLGRILVRMESWYDDNPCRVWRLSERVSRAAIGSIVGVSSTSMREYEKGRTRPPIRVYVALAKAMHMKPEDLRMKWEQWLAKRPTGEIMDEYVIGMRT